MFNIIKKVYCEKSPIVSREKLTDEKRFKLILDSNSVLDNETGLIRERSPEHTITRNWQEAIQYCHSKNHAGRRGWRLTAVEESLSLVDSYQSNPALPAGNPFINITTNDYITATTVVLKDNIHSDFIVTVGNGNRHIDHENII